MKQDTINFLEALLFTADGQDDTAFLDGKTVYDFSPKFTAAVEKFCDAFREHLEHTGFPVGKLDAMERSFGGNVYYSLSGHGCGFFDDNDEEMAALHDVLKAWAGAYRFEGLDGMLDLDGEGKIDLSFIPEAIEEYRAKIFAVPEADIPPGPAPQPPEKADLQRCNRCMSVFGVEFTSCPICGRDDAMMYPFEPMEDGSEPPAHTPGPWKVGNSGAVYTKDCMKMICETDVEPFMEAAERDANASLIAASPLMLQTLMEVQEMLKMARRYMPKSIKNRDSFSFEACNAAVGTAIHKAKGGQ